MKVNEIISEDVIGTGTSLVTVASALGLDPKTPWLNKLVAYAPGTISLLSNIASGQGVTAALDALEVSLGNANLLPKEAKQAVNTFSALRSAHGLAKIPVGSAGAAAVPVAVGVGGYQASKFARNQLAKMTSDQRKAYYDNPMMGAMSGDTGLAAAIMNASNNAK